MKPILEPASRPKLAYHDWDPRYPEVAKAFVLAVSPLPPFLELEHIGSTSIPGCGGKGVIDFMALYRDGCLEEAKAYFLGDRVQSPGSEFSRPWPDNRPMFLGCFRWKTEAFVIYLHIVQRESAEVARFRAFKKSLAANPGLIAEYSSWKRNVVLDGKADSDGYTAGKGPFMHRVLGADPSV